MTDTFLSAKLSQANLTKLGATAADVDAKLTAFLAEHETKLASAAKSDTAAATLNADFTARLAALETNFSAFKAAPPLNAEAILADAKAAAKAEASATATAILAKSGGQPLLNGSTPPDEKNSKPADFKTLVTSKIAAGKTKAVALSESISEQPALYAAWREAGCGSI